MIGTGIKDATAMGWLLSFGLMVIGWLGALLAILVWRSFCEFYMAIMNIADDLRYLRQFQDRLEVPAAPVAAASVQPAVAEAASAVAESPASEPEPQREAGGNIIDDPFFRPRYERRDF